MEALSLCGNKFHINDLVRALRADEEQEEETFRRQRTARRQRAFFKARSEMLRGCSDTDRAAVLDSEKASAKAVGHELTIKGTTLDDKGHCSCGWSGKGHWDGADLEYRDWLWHLLEVGVKLDYTAVSRQTA